MEKLKRFFLENTHTKQIIIKNIVWLFAGEAGGRLIKMGLIVYAARNLGASGWGTFAYAISTASLLMIFSDVGIGSLITRDAIQKRENYRGFISAALMLKAVILAASILLVIFISPYISTIPEATILFPIVGLIFLFDSIRDLGFAINRIFEKMEIEMVVKIVMNLIVLALGIILININPLPISVGVAYAVGGAVSVILILVILWKHVPEFLTKTDFETVKLVLRTTMPLAIIILIGSIMANTDIYMLGLWKTPEDIGLYSAAQRFYQFILIIPATIGTATLPLMSRLAHTDNQKFKDVLEKNFYMFMLVGLPIACGGFIVADEIVPFIFGPQYINAIPVLRVMMVMLLSAFPILLLVNAIFVYNKQRELVFVNVLGVLINIFLNSLLIPKFGVTGAALATLVSSAFVTLAVWGKMKKINDFEILPSLVRILPALTLMAFVTLVLEHLGTHVLLNITISAFVYILIIFLKEKSLREEIKEIMNITPLH